MSILVNKYIWRRLIDRKIMTIKRETTASLLYEHSFIEGKGNVLVSSSELLPGVELFREDPILEVNNNYKIDQRFNSGLTSDERKILAIHEEYQQLDPLSQAKYLNLFGPTSGPAAIYLRNLIENDKIRGLCPSDSNVEEMIRVAMIFRFNAAKFDNGEGVYATACRMSHSCLPNCSWETIEGQSPKKAIRTILPVKTGEELTITYNDDFSLNPTHERRAKYLRTKEFLCNCSRCSSISDDTRGFVCFNNPTTGCKGIHYASQPLASNSPYLLPCTKCNQSPSKEWETLMFQLETKELSKLINGDITTGFAKKSFNTAGNYQDVFSTNPLPLPWHYTATKRFGLKYSCALAYSQKDSAMSFARQCIRTFESMLKYPSYTLIDMYMNVAENVFEAVGTVESLQYAQTSYQKALRMNNIIDGGVDRDSIDVALIRVMVRLHALNTVNNKNQPSTSNSRINNMSECSFCGASPLHMAISLSKCEKCEAVAYCSPKCQASHRVIHKHHCK